MASQRDNRRKPAISSTSAGTEAGTDEVAAVLRGALESISRHGTGDKLFPHGITKISLSINLAGGVSASLGVEGPTSSVTVALGHAIDRSEMESIAPPAPPTPGPGDPKPVGIAPRRRPAATDGKSIAGAASMFNDACIGGDAYDNNCAHYLSDAFVRAGYTELSPPSDCVNARCSTSAKRPIRARDMWCWFQKMATEQRDMLPKKEGYWAVFQLDESQYWGGHVVIIDTDTNTYYGTGNYPNWAQHCYKW